MEVWYGAVHHPLLGAPRCLRGLAGCGMQGTDELLVHGHARSHTAHAMCHIASAPPTHSHTGHHRGVRRFGGALRGRGRRV